MVVCDERWDQTCAATHFQPDWMLRGRDSAEPLEVRHHSHKTSSHLGLLGQSFVFSHNFSKILSGQHGGRFSAKKIKFIAFVFFLFWQNQKAFIDAPMIKMTVSNSKNQFWFETADTNSKFFLLWPAKSLQMSTARSYNLVRCIEC